MLIVFISITIASEFNDLKFDECVNEDFSSCVGGSENYYEDDTREYETCLKDDFPRQTLSDEFGVEIKSCCGHLGFIEYATCNGVFPSGQSKSCAGEICNHHDTDVTSSFPKEILIKCKNYETLEITEIDVESAKFSLDSNNRTIIKTADIELKEFCVAYECFDAQWQVQLYYCYKEDTNQLMAELQEVLNNTKVCCGKGMTLTSEGHCIHNVEPNVVWAMALSCTDIYQHRF